MELRVVAACAVGLVMALSGGACAVVLGTSDLTACESDCGEGGAGGVGASSSQSSGGAGGTGGTGGTGDSSASGADASSSAMASTGTGSACGFVLTLTYEGITGIGRVRIDESPDDADFDEGVSQHCLPAGEKTFEIECRSEDDELDDYPLVVSWGNERCPDAAARCTFQLDSDQTFALTGVCD